MTAAISVTGLTRRYRGQLTLDQVSVDIEAGSVTGLLGRNGAGKPATGLRRLFLTCQVGAGVAGEDRLGVADATS